MARLIQHTHLHLLPVSNSHEMLKFGLLCPARATRTPFGPRSNQTMNFQS
jgi:hypothetical protein